MKKQLLKSWQKDTFSIDPETGKKDKLVSTDIHTLYALGKDRFIAEVETIDFTDPVPDVEPVINVEMSGPKLTIEDVLDVTGGISKKEYKELVRAAIGANVNEGVLSQAIYKAAYKIQKLGGYKSLFYSADWIPVGVELYHSLNVKL